MDKENKENASRFENERELKASSTFVVASNSNVPPTPRLFVPKSTKRVKKPMISVKQTLKTPSPAELPRYLSYMTPGPPPPVTNADIFTPEIDLPLDTTPPPPPDAPSPASPALDVEEEMEEKDDATVIERESIDMSRDSVVSDPRDSMVSMVDIEDNLTSDQSSDYLDDATTTVSEVAMMVHRLSSLTSKVAEATKDLDFESRCENEQALKTRIRSLLEDMERKESLHVVSMKNLNEKVEEQRVRFENFQSETKQRQSDDHRRERSMRHKIEDLRTELEERDRECEDMRCKMERVEKERRELGLHRKGRDEQAKRERTCGVGARSARILIISLEYHCLTHEFENIFNHIPQILQR